MEKLTDKFIEIIEDNCKNSFWLQGKTCAEESKKIAIEFAKYMFKKKIHEARSMDDIREYWPHEFQIMLGELIKDSQGLNFEQFIEEEYGK